MHKRVFFFIAFISLLLCSSITAVAQTEVVPRKKVAIFAPLYLDSAFNTEGKYRFANSTFPKFLNAGIEFYEGAKYAMDSLQNAGDRLEFFIFDTKSKNKSLSSILNSTLLDSIELIITHCNASEAKLFAETALKRNVPVINTNLPNDANAISNPFWVILNPTLRTQCEGVYKLLQKYYSLEQIIVFRKKGPLEDRVKTYFDEYSKSTAGIKIPLKYIDLRDSVTAAEIKPLLDSTVNTICVAGSLDEVFGKKLLINLADLYNQGYKNTVIGMPTWDALSLNKPEFKGPEVIYSNPFYNAKTDKISKALVATFHKSMSARPSDMMFRGYETILKFSKLLLQYNTDFSSNISSKQHKIFTDFDIQPILNKQTMDLDYFENKKLYFLKWQDGVIKAIY
jgi:hypothetical protein